MNLESLKDILIVDDEQGEINELADIFRSDLECEVLTYLYEQDEMSHTLHKGIKIAFFDLNITASSIHTDSIEDINWKANDSLRKVFNELTQAVIDVIDKDNEPYAGIFWTKHSELVDEFKKYMLEKNYEFPNPVHISYIDKVKFRSEPDKKALIENKLKDTVFYNFVNFENLLQDEVKKVMYNILDIANENEMSVWNGDDYHRNLQSFLRALASTHSGFELAKNNPSKSLTEALMPIITDKIVRNAESLKVWDRLLDFDAVNKRDCVFAENNNIPRLNTYFHIDKSPNLFDTRGAVFEIKYPEAFFKEKFDYKPKRVIAETILDFPREARPEVEFILIEISSACDYSQGKVRFNKYIVGLKIPKECYNSYMESLIVDGKSLKGSALDIKSSFLDENTDSCFNIILNKNFVLSLNTNELDNSQLNHLFTFKKEIMDFIGNAYANHISRIGISTF